LVVVPLITEIGAVSIGVGLGATVGDALALGEAVGDTVAVGTGLGVEAGSAKTETDAPCRLATYMLLFLSNATPLGTLSVVAGPPMM
jgi:hypothetical protein